VFQEGGNKGLKGSSANVSGICSSEKLAAFAFLNAECLRMLKCTASLETGRFRNFSLTMRERALKMEDDSSSFGLPHVPERDEKKACKIP
jgi:hypothetical protein